MVLPVTSTKKNAAKYIFKVPEEYGLPLKVVCFLNRLLLVTEILYGKDRD